MVSVLFWMYWEHPCSLQAAKQLWTLNRTSEGLKNFFNYKSIKVGTCCYHIVCTWRIYVDVQHTIHIHIYTYTIVSRKSSHWQSTLQACQTGRGWVLLQAFPHVTRKRTHVMFPATQHLWTRTVTYHRAGGSFKVKPWWHITLWAYHLVWCS